MWTSFSIALRILTSSPVSTLGSPGQQTIRRAIMFFPLVGALVGAVTGAVWVLAARLWPGQLLVAAAVSMIADLFLTGARGLGGVGRSADALFSLHEEGDRSRALAQLRESRRNTGGLIAIVLSALLKASLLASLRPDSAWLTLIVAGCLGQWAVAFAFTLFRLLPAWNNADIDAGRTYASTHGADGTFAGAGLNEFMGAMALAILGAAIVPIGGLLGLGAVAVILGPVAKAIDRSFNGLNVFFGYGLGYVAEIIVIGILALHVGRF